MLAVSVLDHTPDRIQKSVALILKTFILSHEFNTGKSVDRHKKLFVVTATVTGRNILDVNIVKQEHHVLNIILLHNLMCDLNKVHF